ncbi:hypothetical protein ACHAPI_009395 [Fusarium lateritium]
MPDKLIPWAPWARVAKTVRLDGLTITFKRTIRVPDNDESTALPPDMGSFPLFKVDDYADTLPVNMAQKGGLFLPMYQREALWINFKSETYWPYFKLRSRYLVKIYVGGINAISGEPAVPNAATPLRRRNLLKNDKSLQDYIVVPEQRWLDGIAVEPGQVRQFVAMPVGTGHSVEAQMTGEETTAGIQLEITRLDTVPKPARVKSLTMIKVILRQDDEYFMTYSVGCEETLAILKDAVYEKIGAFPKHQRFFYDGKYVREDLPLSHYDLVNGSVLRVVVGRWGGGGDTEQPEMNISAGGRITQSIIPLPQREYRKTVPVTFNVQVLNSASFEHVTGKKPPKSPATAKTYAKCGYPFFSIYEEPTTVSGDFSKVKSIAQIDRNPDQPMPNIPTVDVVTREIVPGLLEWTCLLCGETNNVAVGECETCLERRPETPVSGRVGLFNPHGPNAPLKLAWELAEEVGQMHTAF